MSFTACDLQNTVDELLERLSLDITGDDDDGYTIRRGSTDLRTDQGTQFDSAAEAAAAGLVGLFDRIEDLLNAGQQVVNRWADGDLAAAVRELDVCVRAIADKIPGQAAAERSANRLRARLALLQQAGLAFDDCVRAFGVSAGEDHAITTARRDLEGLELIELPTPTVVRRGELAGAQVMAWVAVSDELPSTAAGR